jgi:hypothetical protein
MSTVRVSIYAPLVSGLSPTILMPVLPETTPAPTRQLHHQHLRRNTQLNDTPALVMPPIAVSLAISLDHAETGRSGYGHCCGTLILQLKMT